MSVTDSTDRPTRLAAILEDEGRRQSWLAERTGISETRLSYIKRGMIPSAAEAKAIAKALGRDVKSVFPQLGAVA